MSDLREAISQEVRVAYYRSLAAVWVIHRAHSVRTAGRGIFPCETIRVLESATLPL